MSASATEEPYQPRYTDIEDVPLGTIDPFDTDTPKREALRRAEGRLEADVNDGKEIGTPKSIHADAVENLATYHLLRPATGPDEARYGAVADYGERQLEYVRTYKEEYNEIVASINAASPNEIEGGDDTSEGEPGEEYNPPFEFETF